MNDCVFCKIVNKELPSEIVFENENVIAFKNIEPVAETHLLVCPKKHIVSFMDFGKEIIDMTHVTQKLISDLNMSSGYKLVFNGGKYQSVPHVHWHLLAGKLENENDILNKT